LELKSHRPHVLAVTAREIQFQRAQGLRPGGTAVLAVDRDQFRCGAASGGLNWMIEAGRAVFAFQCPLAIT